MYGPVRVYFLLYVWLIAVAVNKGRPTWKVLQSRMK